MTTPEPIAASAGARPFLSRIVCDQCDYKEKRAEDADPRDLIDKPCPQCGANLLTAEDYEAARQFAERMAELHAAGLVAPLDPDAPAEPIQPGKVRIRAQARPRAGSLSVTLTTEHPDQEPQP